MKKTMPKQEYDLEQNFSQNINDDASRNASLEQEPVHLENESSMNEVIPQMDKDEQKALDEKRNSSSFQKGLQSILPTDQGKEESSEKGNLNDKVQEWQGAKKKKNNTGIPDNIKKGIEQISGISLDDVTVHYNSPKPEEIGAHAYAEGTDVYISPGQEEHLPHELWHVIQQKQKRAKKTKEVNGKNVDDRAPMEKEATEKGNQGKTNKSTNKEILTVPNTKKVIQGFFYNVDPKNIVDSDVISRIENLSVNYWFPDDAEKIILLLKKINEDKEKPTDLIETLKDILSEEDYDDLLEVYEEKFNKKLEEEGTLKVKLDEKAESSKFIIDLKEQYPGVYDMLAKSSKAYKHITTAGLKGVVLGNNKKYQVIADEAKKALTYKNEIYIPSSLKNVKDIADAIIFEIFNSLGAELRDQLTESDKSPEEIADEVINQEIGYFAEKIELLKDIPELYLKNKVQISEYNDKEKEKWFSDMVKKHGGTLVTYKGKEMTVKESYIAMAQGK